jgi:hypothetical protein
MAHALKKTPGFIWVIDIVVFGVLARDASRAYSKYNTCPLE